MGGGDLLNLLIERDVFEEDFTRFYVAEVGFPYCELKLIPGLTPPRVFAPLLCLHGTQMHRWWVRDSGGFE